MTYGALAIKFGYFGNSAKSKRVYLARFCSSGESGENTMKINWLDTWIRTKINGVRVRCRVLILCSFLRNRALSDLLEINSLATR